MLAVIFEIVVTLAFCALGWVLAGAALEFVDKRAPSWTPHVTVAGAGLIAWYVLRLEGPSWASALIVAIWVFLALVVAVAEAIDPYYRWRVRRAMRQAGYSEETIEREIEAMKAQVEARRAERRKAWERKS